MLPLHEQMQIDVWFKADRIWLEDVNLAILSPGDVYRMKHPVTGELTGPWVVLKHPEVECAECEFPERPMVPR